VIKAEFSASLLLQSFRNHSNMMICCSRNTHHHIINMRKSYLFQTFDCIFSIWSNDQS